MKHFQKPVIFQTHFTLLAYSFLLYSISFLKQTIGTAQVLSDQSPPRMLSLITDRLGYFCSLPCPTQHSSRWLLRCVCAVVKWPNIKLALAFVSCQVLACGEIYLLQTLCSIRELFVAFYFVAGYILLPSSSCFQEY